MKVTEMGRELDLPAVVYETVTVARVTRGDGSIYVHLIGMGHYAKG
jgi:hypothetical protein